MGVPDGVEDRFPKFVFQANLWAIEREIKSIFTGVEAGVVISEFDFEALVQMINVLEMEFPTMRQKLSMRVRK